jgi:membrane protease YdiL (CAAX protease family)
MDKTPKRLRPIDGILIFGISYLVSTIITVFLSTSVTIRTNTALSTLVLLAVSYGMLRLAVCNPLTYAGLRAIRGSLILYSFVASLAVIVPAISVEALVVHYFKIPDELIQALTDIIRARSLPELLYVWTIAAVGAALSEEFVFRGILQNSLASRLRGWLAVLITASVFGVLHTLWRFAPAFILGAFLGFLFWRTRSLLAPLVAHLTINSVAIVGVYIAETRGEEAVPSWLTEDRAAPVWILAASLMVFALAIGRLWTESRDLTGDNHTDSREIEPPGFEIP